LRSEMPCREQSTFSEPSLTPYIAAISVLACSRSAGI
jgi:hypothetical protein